MNKSILLGRIVKDPEVRYAQSGKCVAQFTLAVDRQFKDANGNKEADFIPVVVWNKAAELVGNSCQKGHRLLVDGRLQIRSYDAKDGTKRWVTEIIASSVEFVERRSSTGGSATSSAGAAPTAVGHMEAFGTAVPFDEEIPF